MVQAEEDHRLFEARRSEMGPEPRSLYDQIWNALQEARVVEARQLRADLMNWRRGSAQMATRINTELHNLNIYPELVSDVQLSRELFRYLFTRNNLQRLESLGLLERDHRSFIVLKYTTALGVVAPDAVQRHVSYLQERADVLDTELAGKFGGKLHFEDWNKLDQGAVDDLIGLAAPDQQSSSRVRAAHRCTGCPGPAAEVAVR